MATSKRKFKVTLSASSVRDGDKTEILEICIKALIAKGFKIKQLPFKEYKLYGKERLEITKLENGDLQS